MTKYVNLAVADIDSDQKNNITSVLRSYENANDWYCQSNEHQASCRQAKIFSSYPPFSVNLLRSQCNRSRQLRANCIGIADSYLFHSTAFFGRLWEVAFQLEHRSYLGSYDLHEAWLACSNEVARWLLLHLGWITDGVSGF